MNIPYTTVVLYYDTTLDPIIAAGIFIGAAVFVAACFAVMKICEKKQNSDTGTRIVSDIDLAANFVSMAHTCKNKLN